MGAPATAGRRLPPAMPPSDHFRYDEVVVDPDRSTISCRYTTGGHTFTERFTFGMGGDWDAPAVRAAVRVLFLLAGVSYYKTTAAPLIDLGDHPTTQAERAFLTGFYVHGLGEFAYRNGIDLRGIAVTGPDATPAPPVPYEPDARPAPDPLRRGHRLHRDRRVAARRPPGRRALHRPPARRPLRRH